MAKILNLIYRVKDEGSKTLRKMKDEQRGVVDTFKAAGPVLAATGVAIAAIGKVGYELTQGWLDHTLAIGSFSAQMNITTEETSVLMEIMDDFAITHDTMLAAMRTLAKQGYDPGIEGLIKVREQLDATSSASERLALAQRLIGEQGIKQILPMLDRLTDEQLRNYIDTLTEAEMVTQAEFEQAAELQVQLKDLGDEWDNLKLSVGGFIAGPLLALFDFFDRPFSVDSWLMLANDIFLNFPDPISDTTAKIDELESEMSDLDETVQNVDDAIEKLTEKQYLQAAAEALIAGNVDLANHYLGLAREAGQAGEVIDRLIRKMMEYDGMKVTGEMELIARGFTPTTFIDLAEQTEIMAARQAEYLATVPTFTPPAPIYTAPKSPAGVDPEYWSRMMRAQYGLEFTIGGFGGIDSQLVQFRGTPGEKVRVGEGEMSNDVLAEIRRLVSILPIAVRDAVERTL